MISITDLREHVLAAIDELNLPLTVTQADRLSLRITARATTGAITTKITAVELTNQQHAVLRALAAGESTEATGRRLTISENTVKTHRRALYSRLGAHTSAQAVAVAIAQGLLRVPQLGTGVSVA